MKKISLLFILFISIAMNAKEVPGPTIWYSISQKILQGSHQLVMAEDLPKNHTAKKATKTKVLKVSTKYQQKNELILPDFIGPTTIAKNVWFLPE